MYQLLKKRRSIRKYLNKPIEKSEIEIILKSILRAPRGNNLDSVKVIYIDDKDIIKELSKSKKSGAQLLENAPGCLIILGNEKVTDVWIEDASIATTIAHLSATSLNIGSCWIQIRNRITKAGQSSEDYIQELLGIPTHLRVEALIALGYPAEHKKGHEDESLLFKNLFYNDIQTGYDL